MAIQYLSLMNVADLLGGNASSTWGDVFKLLRRIGYTNAKHYKVCQQQSLHSTG